VWLNGLLNINKPVGMTSHEVVATIRRLTQQRAVGHGGTLDPLASGVLILLLGQATKLSSYVMTSNKTYIAEIALGVATDTDDAEGTIVQRAAVPTIERDELVARLQHFVGDVAQVPPRYAAIKRGGSALYKRARGGEALTDSDLEARQVTIHSLTILDWSPPRLLLQIDASKGTYIRALARDIGWALGSAGYLHSLVRVRSGAFTLASAVTLERLAAEGAANHLLPMDLAVLPLPAAILDQKQVRLIRHGQAIVPDSEALARRETSPVGGSSDLRIYGPDGTFWALARQTPRGWQPFRVLERAE
jgi:tRNA pseudouridine55 synthase